MEKVPKVYLPNCSICQSKLQCNISSTKCGHTFHNDCINHWRKTANKDICPLCRTDLKGTPLQKIFFDFGEKHHDSNEPQLSTPFGIKENKVSYLEENEEFDSLTQNLPKYLFKTMKQEFFNILAQINELKEKKKEKKSEEMKRFQIETEIDELSIKYQYLLSTLQEVNQSLGMIENSDSELEKLKEEKKKILESVKERAEEISKRSKPQTQVIILNTMFR